MKIYLAGPEVFLPDALAIGRRKRDICERHGVTGLYPLDNAVDLVRRAMPRCKSSRALKR